MLHWTHYHISVINKPHQRIDVTKMLTLFSIRVSVRVMNPTSITKVDMTTMTLPNNCQVRLIVMVSLESSTITNLINFALVKTLNLTCNQ